MHKHKIQKRSVPELRLYINSNANLQVYSNLKIAISVPEHARIYYSQFRLLFFTTFLSPSTAN